MWDHLSINKPHLVYIILGGFTSLFMLCSSFIKEKMYIGEATVATICGVIFGPHAANLIDPGTWGNVDQLTLEFSRIVLVVQCFAVGVELPKYYMEKHWRSVLYLLLPVMTFGWLITSLFIWWMIPKIDWLESLCVAACVTATDPVLASSVVGKGKFAKRVPKHLRDVLSAESGCNDGMAFPFIYLALYLIDYKPDAEKVAFHWIVLTILYECVFGAFYGFIIGYIGRHGIKWAEKKDMVDRESFLVFYFVLALFCAGSGSILGVDDLLVGFAAGVGFSNDGWFTQKTEESHVSNVIDLLLNLAYFVYLGTIIPWEQYNNPQIGTSPWRLVVIALFVLFFRRIPIMMALKPLIPDIKTWREALFAGHFGPIGVGAIFVAILARAELETGGTTPLSSYPEVGAENSELVAVIWPVVTFLVISSIIVHGSSIAVFTLGRHINTLTLTMSYTTAHEDGPGWLNRLPRITTTSKSQAKSFQSESDGEGVLERGELPPGTLPPIGIPGHLLRRQREEDNTSRSSSLVPRRRRKKWDDELGPGGPVSQSAIYPQRRETLEAQREYSNSETLTPGDSPQQEKAEKGDLGEESELGEIQHDPEMDRIMSEHSSRNDKPQNHMSDAERHPEKREYYQEGDHLIIENEDGDVVSQAKSDTTRERSQKRKERKEGVKNTLDEIKEEVVPGSKEGGKDLLGYKSLRKKLGVWRHKDEPVKLDEYGQPMGKNSQKRGPALAYQFGNTIIVEDEDGEVVKTYQVPTARKGQSSQEPEGTEKEGGHHMRQTVMRMGSLAGFSSSKPQPPVQSNPETSTGQDTSTERASVLQGMGSRMGSLANWGFSGKNTEQTVMTDEYSEDDDRHIRFTIGGAGRRLTKDDFIREIQSLDPKSRAEVVRGSDAPSEMKALAAQDASERSEGSNRLLNVKSAQLSSGTDAAKAVAAEMARARGGDVDEGSPGGAKGKQRRLSRVNSEGSEMEESAVERKRREGAMRGIDDVTHEQRGRRASQKHNITALAGGSSARSSSSYSPSNRGKGKRMVEISDTKEEETPAERKRRQAALQGGEDSDSDDDDTLRVPPPVVQKPRQGIRFAESPVRGEGSLRGIKR
ncbi:Sodium/hydrogen exchanger family-domain-containing protein [Calycina marina]|uniref:Sodium/hydrogen exchanger family-domain-containing protein n=1 Tax=Calycina marina TaxID=1763456 RepID=A0A9P8CD10_9HELO|nr:Sodium/hydrogen exchanger family-domain-containing protein [Calycina marina]